MICVFFLIGNFKNKNGECLQHVKFLEDSNPSTVPPLFPIYLWGSMRIKQVESTSCTSLGAAGALSIPVVREKVCF